LKKIAITLILLRLLTLIANSQVSSERNSIIEFDTVFFNDPDTNPNVRIEYETIAEFPGGPDAFNTFARKYIKYPLSVLKDSIEGKVLFTFNINENGYASDIKFIRKLNPACEKQCEEMVNQLPQFKPGTMLTKSKKGWYWRPVKVISMGAVYFAPSKRNLNYNILIITP
jgi:hypothetical protein